MYIGLGDTTDNTNKVMVNVYCANRPPMPPYDELDHCAPLHSGDIALIAQQTGNHWRKIFNVYAKLIHELSNTLQQTPAATSMLGDINGLISNAKNKTWQQYREQTLLQSQSATRLLFNAPTLKDEHALHIIMGKGYAEQLGYSQHMAAFNPHDAGFACHPTQPVIVCPYFDYRQLSNAKITVLVSIVLEMLGIKSKPPVN